MHVIVVLAVEPVVAFDLAIATQVFEGAPGLYEVIVCTAAGGRVTTTSGFSLSGLAGLEVLEQADTVLVPGFRRSGEVAAAVGEALRAAHRRGARIASICTGAFALAEAGLLDGRRATTHWFHAEALARHYPSVLVDPDVLYVDEGAILTSAGMAAGLDLCLHMVELDHGPEAALDRSRHMVTPRHRLGGQAQYIPTPPRSEITDLEPVLEWARENLDRPIRLADLAQRAHVAPRTLARYFNTHLGLSPFAWLTRERVHAAAVLLEDPSLNVAAIAERTGLGSAANLRSHFTRTIGSTPSAYRSAFYPTLQPPSRN